MDLVARFSVLSFPGFSPIPTSLFLSSSPPFFCLLLLHFIQAPCAFFLFFFLISLHVSNPLPYAYLYLTSLSSTPLYYEVQLTISPPKIIFIVLHLCTSPKIYMTIELFICLKRVPRCTKTHIACHHH